MSAQNTDFNPFQAPTAAAPVEANLRDSDEYLVFARMILCRQTVHLPPLCIRYGEADGVEAKSDVLRTLTAATVLKIIAAAVICFGLPMWISMHNAPFFRSGILNGLTALSLIGLFGLIVWWSAKRGMVSVNVTWYTCARYRRYLRWNKLIVRALIFGGALVAGAMSSFEMGHGWPLFICLSGAAVVVFGYDPEIKLQLAGRKKEAYVLRGHSTAFHKAVLAQESAFWAKASEASPPVPDSPTAAVNG